MDPLTKIAMCKQARHMASAAYAAARHDYNRIKPVADTHVAKLYLAVLRARCSMQAGAFRGDREGKAMYDEAAREEERLLRAIVRAVEEDPTCASFSPQDERPPDDEVDGIAGVRRAQTRYGLELTDPTVPWEKIGIVILNGPPVEITLQKKLENVRLAHEWCKKETAHNTHEAILYSSIGYWTGAKAARGGKKGKKGR